MERKKRREKKTLTQQSNCQIQVKRLHTHTKHSKRPIHRILPIGILPEPLELMAIDRISTHSFSKLFT